MSGGDDDDDEVGYKRPPKKHRFKPGQSGNSNGRPRRKWRALVPDQLRRDFLEIADELVEVKTPRGIQTLTTHQLILRALASNAAKGKPSALREWMQSYGEFVQKRYDRFPEVRFVDLLIRIAEGQKGERDELLEQTLAAHIKAIKDLL